jgi:hypothetical protein
MKKYEILNHYRINALLVFTILISSCVNKSQEDTVTKKNMLAVFEKCEILKDNEIFCLKINSVTNFKWDKMYAFTNAYGEEDFEEQLGFEWEGAVDSDFDHKNNMFVFTHNDKVVSFVYFEGTNYDKHDMVFGGTFSKKIKYPESPYYSPNDYIFIEKNNPNYNSTFRFWLFDQQALKERNPPIVPNCK